MLTRILSKARWVALNLLRYVRNATQRRAAARTDQPIVLFDLRSDPYDRYLTILVHFFQNNGFTVMFRARLGMLAAWNTNLLLRKLPSTRFVLGRPSAQCALIITDQDVPAPGIRTIRLRPDHFGPPRPGIYRLPMPMCEDVYLLGLQEPGEPPPEHPLRTLERLPVFFCGNFDPRHYQRADLGRVFGVMNRIGMRDHVERMLPSDVLHPKSLIELASANRPIRIVDRHKDFDIAPLELRWILARTDFFLAFPGIAMPWTHSVVEAMSLGAIPILQFPLLFEPHLRPGLDCLSFDDPESLRSALLEAISASPERIKSMKANVLEYYRRYMTPENVIGRIVSGTEACDQIRLMAEHTSVGLLERTGPIPYKATAVLQ